MQNVEKKIDELKNLLLSIRTDSPRLTRNEAKKFMSVGEEKFRLYKKMGIIKERTDHFGAKYFLKHELMKVLEDDAPLIKKRAVIKTAVKC